MDYSSTVTVYKKKTRRHIAFIAYSKLAGSYMALSVHRCMQLHQYLPEVTELLGKQRGAQHHRAMTACPLPSALCLGPLSPNPFNQLNSSAHALLPAGNKKPTEHPAHGPHMPWAPTGGVSGPEQSLLSSKAVLLFNHKIVKGTPSLSAPPKATVTRLFIRDLRGTRHTVQKVLSLKPV